MESVGEYRDDFPNGNHAFFWRNGDVWVGTAGQNSSDYSDSEWFSGTKYTAGNVPPEVLAIRGNEPPPTSSSSMTSMDKAKSQCEELGFEPKTEKFGDCVLRLMEMN